MTNITTHEFSDDIAGTTATNADEDTITIKFTAGAAHWTFFDKDDVIAMAKHFKVTEEELK
jgi:hypothetical protein